MKKQDIIALREGVKKDIATETQALMAHQAKKTTLSRSSNAIKLLRVGGDISDGTASGLKSTKSSLEEVEGEIARIEGKIEALKECLQGIRKPEDIELELKRTEKRFKFFRAEKDRTLRKLALATGLSLSKLRKLPPIAPERRSAPNALWD